MDVQGLPEQDVDSGNNMVSTYTEEKRRQTGKLVLMGEVSIERYITIEYINFKEELMRLRIQRMAILQQR